MKTLEQIAKEYKSQTLDGRDLTRLAQFIPFDMLGEFGIEPTEEYNNSEKWNTTIKPFTKENILAQLREDVEFGFEKALDRRGISASLMYEVVKMWNWILEDGLEDFDSYAQYGLPLFKTTAVKYGFDNPIGDMEGDEYIFSSDSEEWFEY